MRAYDRGVGFGYKTSWIAVRDRSPLEVADALELVDRQQVRWAEGTERAYQQGVHVSAPRPGWTLAHGARHLPPTFDATDPPFLDWLVGLSERLGEVQFFGTHRVVDYHAWAWARDGRLLRAYCYLGERGEVCLFAGEPTSVERGAGVGTRGPDAGSDEWSESEWDAWRETTPREEDVLCVAGAWSVDPTSIDDDVAAPGILGVPAELAGVPPRR